MSSTNLWSETPLIHSTHISNLLNCSAYLKLENLHPSQSFKYRGLSLFAQRALAAHGPSVHLIIASGGNAALAVACAAQVLGVRCTVFITEGASTAILAFLEKQGAEVVITGKYYTNTLARAEEAVGAEEAAVMVPAYDDPVIWDGHSSMITEIHAQLPRKPDAIVCAVGGGGLLGGVLVGCANVGWDDVPVVTLETHGANCFYQSVGLNPGKWNAAAHLPPHVEALHDPNTGVALALLKALPSRATSLAASSPAAGVVRLALDRAGETRCVCIPDEMAMQAVCKFAEDHKTLVELACGATLAAAYSPSLLRAALPSLPPDALVVFVVCGGFKISLAEIAEYSTVASSKWETVCDGETVTIEN